MIRFERSVQVKSGKFQEAVAVAHEVNDHIRANYSGTDLGFFSGQFGQQGRLVWHFDFEDLAALEAFQQRLAADEEYGQIVSRGQDVIVPGSIYDEVLASR